MDLQSKSNGSGRSEAIEPIELPVFERGFSPYLADNESPLLHYWRILKKRRWSVVATLAIILALTIIFTLKTTPLYQATSKVAIFPETPNVLGFKDGGNSSSDYDYESTLETQAAILRSDALAMKVIEGMRLDQNPKFTGGTTRQRTGETLPVSSMQPDPAVAAGLLGRFRGGLSVQLIPDSRLVQISFTHPDPRLATEIANALVRTFTEENFKTRYEAVTQTSDWLSTELADLQMKVQTSEEKLVRYQKDHSILGVDEKQNIVTAKLDELNRELTAAQTDRIQKESNYRLSTEGDPAAFSKTSQGASTMLERLREKEADLNTQLAQFTTQFGSGYPKVAELGNQVKQIRAEIAAEEVRMQQQIHDEYLAALQRETLLTTAFNQQKQEANQLNESAIEYSVLKRDAEANRQLYQDLLQRLKEAGVSAGLRSSNIRVVDVARIPTSPIKPNVPRNIELGLILGLACGVALAFTLETLDTSIRSIEEIKMISTLPALGTIPLQSGANGSLRKRLTTISTQPGESELPALVTYARPRSEAAEAYRSLRTSILLSSFGAPPKVILVTSALPQEGKLQSAQIQRWFWRSVEVAYC